MEQKENFRIGVDYKLYTFLTPGNDEELHPRILTPEIVTEGIDELSIDALSTTGTVEDIN